MRRVLLILAALSCLCFAAVRSQISSTPSSTTQRASGELRQNMHWSFLYKVCISPGSHTVLVKYFFPSSSMLTLSQPSNYSESEAPWIMLYQESKWQDAYFYIVSCFHCVLCHSVNLTGNAGPVRGALDGYRPYVGAATGAGWLPAVLPDADGAGDRRSLLGQRAVGFLHR